jgi:hypothetical protein
MGAVRFSDPDLVITGPIRFEGNPLTIGRILTMAIDSAGRNQGVSFLCLITAQSHAPNMSTARVMRVH